MRNKLILNSAVLLSIAFMVGIAEISGMNEIIFPEITAVAIGALVAPKQSWNTTPLRLFISISIMSLCGVAIVRYIPLSRVFTLPLSFCISIISLIISKTGFVPQISACVLPVFLGTETIIYPASVIFMTALIILIKQYSEKTNIHNIRIFEPEAYNTRRYIFYIHQIIIVTFIFEIALLSNQLFFAVPPLIVGYIEAVQPESGIRKRPLTAIFMILFAALAGTFSRIIINDYLKMPLMLSAVFSVFLLLLMSERLKMYLPPAGAICTLPMLIKPDNFWIYPIETTVGFTVMILIAFVYNKAVGYSYTKAQEQQELSELS